MPLHAPSQVQCFLSAVVQGVKNPSRTCSALSTMKQHWPHICNCALTAWARDRTEHNLLLIWRKQSCIWLCLDSSCCMEAGLCWSILCSHYTDSVCTNDKPSSFLHRSGKEPLCFLALAVPFLAVSPFWGLKQVKVAKHVTIKGSGFSLRSTGFLDFCPSSAILNATKHNVLETGSISALRWLGEIPTVLDPLERASLNHWITGWTKFRKSLLLIVMHHHQNPSGCSCLAVCFLRITLNTP
jgi:hypothetical protein